MAVGARRRAARRVHGDPWPVVRRRGARRHRRHRRLRRVPRRDRPRSGGFSSSTSSLRPLMELVGDPAPARSRSRDRGRARRRARAWRRCFSTSTRPIHNTTGAAAVTILFGSVFTIERSSTVPVDRARSRSSWRHCCAVIARPLLLGSVSPELAAARGDAGCAYSATLYLLALALSVALCALTIGSILSTALLDRSRRRRRCDISRRPGRAAAASRPGSGSPPTWLGILLSYDSYDWPPYGRSAGRRASSSSCLDLRHLSRRSRRSTRRRRADRPWGPDRRCSPASWSTPGSSPRIVAVVGGTVGFFVVAARLGVRRPRAAQRVVRRRRRSHARRDQHVDRPRRVLAARRTRDRLAGPSRPPRRRHRARAGDDARASDRCFSRSARCTHQRSQSLLFGEILGVSSSSQLVADRDPGRRSA